MLDKKQETVLPDTKNDLELADSFINYFTNKIDKIRSQFVMVSSDDTSIVVLNYPLSSFQTVTVDDIHQIVLSHGIKCSPEDSLPSDVLRNNIDLFLPIWTELVNLSLTTGSMECLKAAVLVPLIKDLDDIVDKDNQKNYRPISNLKFVGKLIERVVSAQLQNHMKIHNLNSNSQYGYKKDHSTETLLLCAVNDLLLNLDNNKSSILMLIDLSAAFDTVDQTKLLTILYNEIGVTGIAFKWFSSFLKGRMQRVKIRNTYSSESSLPYGVPQGSVLMQIY